MSRYILSEEARIDLREIKDYIANDSIDVARLVLTADFRRLLRVPVAPANAKRPQSLGN